MQQSVQKTLFSRSETEKEKIADVQSKKDIIKQPHGAKEKSVRPKIKSNQQKRYLSTSEIHSKGKHINVNPTLHHLVVKNKLIFGNASLEAIFY